MTGVIRTDSNVYNYCWDCVVPRFGEEVKYFFTCKKDNFILLGGNKNVASLSYESSTMCRRVHMEPE